MKANTRKFLIQYAVYEYKNVIGQGNAFGLFPTIKSRLPRRKK